MLNELHFKLKGEHSLYNKFLSCILIDYTHVENEASYAVFKEGDTLSLYFQHSNGKIDWKNNLDFPAKPYRDMEHKWYCHRGFLKVWKSIEPYIAEQINDPTVKNIEIAGYSHGAAIAALCYEYVKYHRPDASVSGVGFGAPRVLWGFASKTVLDRFKGFVVVRYSKDIVTHVPPTFLGFRHVGEILKIGGKSKGLINDHRPENYVEGLDELNG